MFRRLPADRDTYITDRIIEGTRRTISNVGGASTLDLFKIYGINLSASIPQNELSRILIHFSLDDLRALTGSTLNIRHSSFKCYLNLRDTYGGQTCPSNFNVVVYPLSRSFDEGIGKNVVTYNDIDSANFITSSFSGSTSNTWYISGANKGGLLNSTDIDYITSGNLSDGNGVANLSVSQFFPLGTEDLNVDVTTLISATLSNQIPDQGFRISFISSQEDDLKTRFVKRFASRHISDKRYQPRLIVKYNDAVQDNQKNFYFDVSGSLFLYNYDYDGPANLVSGSGLTAITGNNSLLLHLVTDKSGGLYTQTVTASQHVIGTQTITGVYSASFAVPSNTSAIKYRIPLSSSIEWTQIWSSLDDTVGYYTGSLKIKTQPRGISKKTPFNYIVNATNVKSVYRTTDRVRIRVFVQDIDDPIEARKVPFERDSVIFHKSYYSIRDSYTNDVIIPFETTLHSTRLSTDAEGMYFELFMSDLDPGRSYVVDLLNKDGDIDQLFKNISPRFRIDEWAASAH